MPLCLRVGVDDDDEDEDNDEYEWDEEADWVDPSENGVLGERLSGPPQRPSAVHRHGPSPTRSRRSRAYPHRLLAGLNHNQPTRSPGKVLEAAEAGDADLLRSLLPTLSVGLESLGPEGDTPLHLAALYGESRLTQPPSAALSVAPLPPRCGTPVCQRSHAPPCRATLDTDRPFCMAGVLTTHESGQSD